MFVSGTMGEEVAVDALQRGVTDYVLKQRLDRLGPAVRRAVAEAEEGDAILWAGSGTTEYLDIGGVKHPFSFRQHAIAALAERSD